MAILELDADSVVQNAASFAALHEVLLKDLGKTPHARGVDLLTTSDLVLGTTESLQGVLGDGLTATDGAQNLPNLDTCDSAIGFAESTTMSVWRRSAPAHESILLIRMTWKGCTRIRCGTRLY